MLSNTLLDTLALHPQTRTGLEYFINSPGHALLLVGAEGSGKQYMSLMIISTLLSLPIKSDVLRYPYLKLVAPDKDKTSIGIEAIRELHHFISLKLPGELNKRRFIIIPEAHNLTIEAQNALLKLLEEPPPDTIFIITTTSEQALLPTVRSRVEHLTIHRPSRTVLDGYFTAQGHEPKAIQQAFFMSGGLPGLMTALLTNDTHLLKTAALAAKQLLQANKFERLCQVDTLAKKRSEALDVLLILRYMSQAAIEQGAQIGGETGIKRIAQWHKVLQACYEAEKAYAVNAQAKLVLTNFMLAL